MAEAAGREGLTCPDCGTPVRPDRERLCPKCGYLLASLRTAPDPTSFGPARIPGEPGEATSVLPPKRADPTGTVIDGAPLPGPGEVDCPRCQERNPRERVRCQRCGLELRTQQAVAPPPLAFPPPAPPRPSGSLARKLLPVAGAILGAAALIGAAVFLAGRGPDLDGGSPGGSGAAPAGLVQADPQSIRASASSTNPDAGFAVANTLDGDARTTWQSDGGRLRSNVGVRLTYQFESPVQLARITLVNGDGRTPEDYANNQRVKRLRLTSGSWSARWNLDDTAEAQSLDIDAGAIDSLTLEVENTYEGNRFKDLAVTEISFYVRS
jgi:hypothetical protein